MLTFFSGRSIAALERLQEIYRPKLSGALLPLPRVAAGVETGNDKQGFVVFDDKKTVSMGSGLGERGAHS